MNTQNSNNSNSLPVTSIGHTKTTVSSFGLGLMGMSDFYGSKASRDDKESLATIHMAMERGITFFNTADFYGTGHNETLLAQAIKGRRDKIFISVKFGVLRGPNGEFFGLDTRPAAVKNFVSYTLQRLGTDHIDLYEPARIDPSIPIEETVGAIADLIKQGKVRHIGLSESSEEQIRRAHRVHPISAVEVEYSLASRVVEEKILPVTRELGITLVAYGALSRGLLSGTLEGKYDPADFRSHAPRFSGDHFTRNQELVRQLAEFAEKRGYSAPQIALAWVANQGKDIITLIGTTKRSRLEENLKAADIRLNSDDMKFLNMLFKAGSISGDRYPAPQMGIVVK